VNVEKLLKWNMTDLLKTCLYIDLLTKRPDNHGTIMNSGIRVLGVTLYLTLEKEKITDIITFQNVLRHV